jgi:hypothetical protein
VILFKKQLFDLEVKGQGPTKVITVRDTPPYGHAPTYQISLTYHERQKSYGPDKLRWEEAEAEEKIWLKQYVSLRLKERHKYWIEGKKNKTDSTLMSLHEFLQYLDWKCLGNIWIGIPCIKWVYIFKLWSTTDKK